MLSSVCEVTSWLDWWLSTCGSFREHLTDEERGNFERLMLSGLRALEFLGGQGVTALGSLVLSCRDSLLLDVRSTVPADEVARLCYADLPSSSGLFSSPLLDSALDKMRTASNNALVQRTLHSPKIPWKSSAGPSKAGSSSASSADRGGASPVVPRSQKQASTAPLPLPLPSRVRSSGDTKARRPFQRFRPLWWQMTRCREKSPPDRVPPLLRVGGLSVSALETLADCWGRILGAVCPEGRIPHPLQGFSSSPRSHPNVISDLSGRISSVTGLAPGGQEDVVQGCLGNCPRSGSWLLQSPFPGRKGDEGLASCDRPLSPERVCSANSVPDGDSSLRASVRQRGGFPSFHRSEGRVYPDTHSSVVEEAIEVPVGGDSLSVQSPVLRAVDCPSGPHSGVCSGICDSSSQVPRRLAGSRLFGDFSQKERPGSALALSLPRPLADCKLPRYDHRYWGRQDFSIPCVGREISVGGRHVLYYVRSPRSALAGGFRTPGFAGEVGSSQSTSNALSAEAFEDALVSRVGLSLPPGTVASI